MTSSTIVCSMSAMSVGCTFIDWSIHYLTNQTRYFSIGSKTWIDLSPNPVTKLNAHGHQKNHPYGIASTQQALDLLESLPTELYSIYPVTRLPSIVAKELGLDIYQYANKDVKQAIENYQLDDNAKIFEVCSKRAKVIYVADDKRTANLFSHFKRHAEIKFTSLEKPENTQALADEQDQLWNAESIKKWEAMGLSNIWDVRERKALDMRPAGKTVDQFGRADFSLPHFRLYTRDLWANGETAMVEIMKYLNLSIDQQRWGQWISIYNQWRHSPSMIQSFVDNIDHILECIVNGWQYQLPELSLEHEAMIQHFLIYRFNLNLKTWQLTKFPNNTAELHKLLEPNTHQLVHTYQDL